MASVASCVFARHAIAVICARSCAAGILCASLQIWRITGTSAVPALNLCKTAFKMKHDGLNIKMLAILNEIYTFLGKRSLSHLLKSSFRPRLPFLLLLLLLEINTQSQTFQRQVWLTMPMSMHDNVESVAAWCRSFIKAFYSFYHHLRGSFRVISNSRDVLVTLNVSF